MDAWYNEKKPNYLGSSFSGADVLTTLDKYIASKTANPNAVNDFKMMINVTSTLSDAISSLEGEISNKANSDDLPDLESLNSSLYDATINATNAIQSLFGTNANQGSSWQFNDIPSTLATNFTCSGSFEDSRDALNTVNSIIQYLAEIGTRLKTLEAK